jgi:ClpP class serine protease
MGNRLEGARRVQMRGNVAVLGVEGPLFRYANLFTMFSGAESYELLATDFNAALDNPNVESIVLAINSPGGMTDGASEFSNMVYGARKKKKVVAYVSHMGASAAYWIASAASQIIMADTASVGSIGTVARIQTDKEKDVVEIVSSQSPKKRVDVKKEEGRAAVQEYVDALSKVFIDTVARNRGVSAETVLKDYGQGGIVVGENAVKIGMADKIGSLESVIAGLSKSNHQPSGVHMNDATKTIAYAALTLALLSQERPDLVQSIQSEGRTAGKKEGAEGELARVKDVLAQSMPGHEDLVNQLAFDGKTTGAEAAVQILAAERKTRGDRLTTARSEAPAAAPASTATTTAATPKEPKVEIAAHSSFEQVKEACKAEFEASADLKAEFTDLDTYAHFKQNEARGNVKYLKQKQA